MTYDTRASVERKKDERVGRQCFLDSVVEEPIGIPPIDVGSPVGFVSVHVYERKGHALKISAADKEEGEMVYRVLGGM